MKIEMGRIPALFERLVLVNLLILWSALTFSPALVEISFSVALGAWLIRQAQHRGTGFLRSFDRPMVGFLSGFVMLSILSYFWSELPGLSFRGVFKVLQQLFIFLMVLDTFQSNETNRKWFFVVMSVLSVVLLVNAGWQYAFGWDFLRGFKGMDSSAGYRVSASFKTYGLLASYLICMIPIWAGISNAFFQRGKRYWIFYAFITLFSLIVLYWTRSRGAFLSLTLGGMALIFLQKKFKLLWLLIISLSAALFVLPKGAVIHLDGYGKEQSLVERYYLWDRAFQVIAAKPLTGTGINTYAEAHARYDKTNNWRVRRYYAHNGYLQMAAETGLPSVFCFLMFLGCLFRFVYRRILELNSGPDRAVLWGLFIGGLNFLIFTTVDTVLHNPQPSMTFWYLLGLLSALSVKRSSVALTN